MASGQWVTMLAHLLRFPALGAGISRASGMALAALAGQAAGLAGAIAARHFVPRVVHYRALVSSSVAQRGVRGGQASKRFSVARTLAAMSSQPSVPSCATLHAAGNASAPSAQETPKFSMTGEGNVKVVELEEPVVTVNWLHANLQSEDIKVVDASWYMPAEQRSPRKEYEMAHIPKALFFDLDKVVDLSSSLPHMLPSEDAFGAAVSALGIANKDLVVVYDGKGIFSAGRVWWMFRAFGHEKVVVLDGGLQKWQGEGYEIESGVAPETLEKIEAATEAVKRIHDGENAFWDKLSFNAVLQPHLVWSIDQVKQNLNDKTFHLIDARSRGRFDGTIPEPRAGIRGGHIPGSTCIPYTEVLSSSGSLLPAEVLEKKFKAAGVSLDGPVVASCGTGVTACILALALYRLRKKDVAVYDGSWTEWGLSLDTPVAVQ